MVRIFNLYGETNSARTLVGKINNYFKKNRKKKLNVANLSSYRDYLHIKTAARMLFKVCQKGKKKGIYNICSSKPTLVRTVVKHILKEKKLIFKNSINEKKYFLNKNSNVKVIYGSNDRIKNLIQSNWNEKK